jgi:amidase
MRRWEMALEIPTRTAAVVALVLVLSSLGCDSPRNSGFPFASQDPFAWIREKSIADLQADMTAGLVTAAELVDAYLARIEQYDTGPSGIHAVLAPNPRAHHDAVALDEERKSQGARGPLHGIPILLKANIESLDPLPTTAGSLALTDNLSQRDAPVVARLRQAGAVVLGKSNLTEWANARGNNATSGWSAVGGLTVNPYALDHTACGSSSGSAAAVTANLISAAVGTETDGSIICPSTMNGVVGLKPTVGLVPRTHTVPISHTQDTAGPIGRTVADVAVLLSTIVSWPSHVVGEVSAQTLGMLGVAAYPIPT